MKKKIGFLMISAIAASLIDLLIVPPPSALAVKPQYLESCTYDANGFVLWYTCGYENHGDSCNLSNC